MNEVNSRLECIVLTRDINSGMDCPGFNAKGQLTSRGKE